MAALLAGSSLTFAYAPFNQWWLTPLALTLLFLLMLRKQGSGVSKTAFAFGLGWFGAGVSWVHVSIADFGGLPLVGSLGLMALLCSYLALFPALFAWGLNRFFRRSLWPLAAAVLWFACEWLRSWFLTGFPWLSIGYSQLHSPLSGWMPVVGETGISALLILATCALAVGINSKRFMWGSIPLLVLGISGLVLNQVDWVHPSGKTINIAMVQGNIKQELRWVPEQDRPTMDKYLNMTASHWDHDIIIWPEAAVPKLEPLARHYLHNLDEQAAINNTSVITGIVNYNFETNQAFNNLIVLGKQSADDKQGHYRYFHGNRFAKHHLLPIGEFIPMEEWLRGLAPIFDLPMSSFTRGDYQQANLQANGFLLAPAICFEIAFPRQIRANLYENTDVIITVSNDAWFGRSHGPAQHMQIAQVRAKEFGLPVVRATNNGITGFVDHNGQLQSYLPQFEAAVLSDTLTLTTGNTPYRLTGDMPFVVLCILLLFGLVFMQKRTKQD